MMNRLLELSEQADTVSYLDTVGSIHSKEAYDIHRTLSSIDPHEVLEQYGREVLMWIYTFGPCREENGRLSHVLESEAGYNLQDLETSRLWQWNIHGNRTGKVIEANYQLMQEMKQETLEAIDLDQVLTESTLPDITLSAKRLGRYALIPLELSSYNTVSPGGRVKGWNREVREGVKYDMWLDAPIGFALTYNGLPNAMAGIAMSHTDELMIYQIQGVQGKRFYQSIPFNETKHPMQFVKSRGLVTLDWKKMLVMTAEAIGRHHGVRALGIQAAKNNHWVRPQSYEEEAHLPFDNATRIYDQTAARLDFHHKAEDQAGNWFHTIGR